MHHALSFPLKVEGIKRGISLAVPSMSRWLHQQAAAWSDRETCRVRGKRSQTGQESAIAATRTVRGQVQDTHKRQAPVKRVLHCLEAQARRMDERGRDEMKDSPRGKLSSKKPER